MYRKKHPTPFLLPCRDVREARPGHVFHVLNRGVGRMTLFGKEHDYLAFENLFGEARERVPMRLLAYCLMPNHWHLILWPRGDGDLADYMRWLTQTHTQRWHRHRDSAGEGPIYQGRYKSFPIEHDDHFFQVARYVERNALRANLVSRAELWRWNSLWHWHNDSAAVSLDPWPSPRGTEWIQHVNQPQSEAELAAIRKSLSRGMPFGSGAWREETARELGLERTLRPRGRPRKV